MQPIHLAWVDYTILIAYVAFVLGIGWALARYMKSSSDFLTSARSIPTWVTGLAFISANLGALELVGMAASGAKYGIATAHFYWVGAIPAMIFLAVFMMPFYYGSKARSVPEYLQMRFNKPVMGLNAIGFAIMTVFASGISMNALAKLLNQLLGWNYHFALFVCSGVVLVYVLKGGLTSAIYTEVLQFFMIVLGFAPVVYLALKDVGGWSAMTDKLHAVAQNPMALDLNTKSFAPDAWTSAWKPLLGGYDANPMGVNVFAIVFGLGFVLSFGYWCTNFLVVQRAMAAKNMTAARNTPIVAAIPKMLFPALVILPGMLAVALTAMPDKDYRIPPPIIAPEAYTQAVDVVKSANPADSAAAVKAVADALGKKSERGQNHRAHRRQCREQTVRRPDQAGHLQQRRRIRLRQRHLLAREKILSGRPARPGAHRLARLVHVRHGGQCHRLQHRLDLQPLPGLLCAEQKRRALFLDGQVHHRRRHWLEHRLRLFRPAIQQRHGHHPAGVRLRERAGVRDVPVWHVLEAHHQHRRILWFVRRHRRLGRFPRADHCARATCRA